MKKWLPLIIIAVVAIGIYSWVKGVNNTAVTLNENIKESWGNVETAYERRNSLIENLVNTVKGAADFEKSTLEAVINARSKATQTTVDASNVTPEQLAAFSQAQSGVNSALSRLLVSVERYPDLKANQNFIKLQDELVSTENQILTARTRFNEAVKPYNNHIKVFPNNLLAGILGFSEKGYFKASEGAENAPEVNFDFK
ncbi:LemA family protein [Flavobacterium sp. CBA20B-1]|uniref:LemA family protein n=1 Tax=unclassified Flavobacterium TaxID=196869 RepID=UPI002223F800|nr:MULTISPECIES: LemA family protein [unclassified Flavobacterium]WCM41627.1 LemA family protein [Flavobacterium sp. CBA20B-1]